MIIIIIKITLRNNNDNMATRRSGDGSNSGVATRAPLLHPPRWTSSAFRSTGGFLRLFWDDETEAASSIILHNTAGEAGEGGMLPA